MYLVFSTLHMHTKSTSFLTMKYTFFSVTYAICYSGISTSIFFFLDIITQLHSSYFRLKHSSIWFSFCFTKMHSKSIIFYLFYFSFDTQSSIITYKISWKPIRFICDYFNSTSSISSFPCSLSISFGTQFSLPTYK